MKLNLTASEKQKLRANKVKIGDIPNLELAELELILETSFERAREIYALATFQTIPSIGVEFAKDLIFLNYFSLNELKGETGASLVDAYEIKKGYKVDACVEDQFRLAVYVAKTQDRTKKWWNFTGERKQYRLEHGYPDTRPPKAWFEI